MITDDVFFSTITELNAGLLKRDYSTVELVRAFAQRLETLGPKYNALALPLTKDALARAKEIDKELKLERLRGPLQGIPFGAKDLLALEGYKTTWGAKPYQDQVLDETATVLTKLDKTGAVIIGKLAMVELAGGPTYGSAAASLFGPGLNPWDVTRWSGGSSSGSGSAVAAGLVPFALGSETSGSIICPSAFCGVTGLRPTYGLVSRYGAMALAWTMDKIGPLCRTAEDCGLVLEKIAGGDSKDPGSAGKSFYYTPQYARKVSDLKIGFDPADMSHVDAAAKPVFTDAMHAILATGVQSAETKLPDFPYDPIADTVVGAEGSSVFETLITSGKVNQLADAEQIAGLKAGLTIPAKDYLKAMRIRSLVKSQFRQLFSSVDVLVAPAMYIVAPKISEPLDQVPFNGPPAPGAPPGMINLVTAANLAGLPGISFPCGFVNGMPVGLQLVGPPFSENTLIAIAREYQNRTDWHKRRPPAPPAG